MQVYFSHSYRDVAVNGYFIERLMQEDIPLRADQKTDVWCVAKLERYLAESTGFISVIPRRPTDEDPGGYSPYIGRELNLARRARVPRLLFIDEKVLKQHRLEFPEDAVPFDADALGGDAADHNTVIRQFRISTKTVARRERQFVPGEAAVVASGLGRLGHAARDLAEILRRHDFHISHLFGKFDDNGLDLEAIWRAELCVFLLGEKLLDTHVALALAHAHCIPSIRLQLDRRVAEPTTLVSGTIRWRDPSELLVEFQRQVSGYREGLVRPIEIAQAGSGAEAARSIGTMNWRARDDNYWNKQDGEGLLHHVRPDQNFVIEEANRVRRAYGSPLAHARSREATMEMCRLSYKGVLRFKFGFEFEPLSLEPDFQVIRTPAQIQAHKTANCLDLVHVADCATIIISQDNSASLVLTGSASGPIRYCRWRIQRPDWMSHQAAENWFTSWEDERSGRFSPVCELSTRSLRSHHLPRRGAKRGDRLHSSVRNSRSSLIANLSN